LPFGAADTATALAQARDDRAAPGLNALAGHRAACAGRAPAARLGGALPIAAIDETITTLFSRGPEDAHRPPKMLIEKNERLRESLGFFAAGFPRYSGLRSQDRSISRKSRRCSWGADFPNSQK
jgi:hypothetical protein